MPTPLKKVGVFCDRKWSQIFTLVKKTSQLSNSNKYMSYRESYLMIPMMLTLSTANGVFTPATAATSSDYAMGLKNWFGSIIHSFTLD